MEKSLISVIVMCYNNESLLKGTLDSILNQTYSKIEIIISDDGSKNYSEKERQEFILYCKKKTEHVISNHNIENIGTVRHFNELIKKASGQYIVPLSCGDKFYDNYVLEKVNDSFNESHALVITGKRIGMTEGNSLSLPYKNQIKILKSDFKKKLQYIYKYADLISGACTYYSKEVFAKYGLFDEQYRLLEDCPYYIHLFENNINIKYVNTNFIHYDMGGVSTGGMHPLLKKDMNLMFQNILKHSKLSFFSKRVVNYRIKKYKRDAGKIGLLELLYPDVMFLLVYNSIRKKL